MKLSLLTETLNTLLETNLIKPNKTRLFKPQHGDEKTVLSYPSDCNVSNLKELEDSKTKVFVNFNNFPKLFTELLKKKYPKLDFHVWKDTHSTFDIRVANLNVKDIGLDVKYQPESQRAIHLASFKLKQSNTDFGESSNYDHNVGKPKATKTVSKIVVEHHYDVDLLDKLIELVTNDYDRKQNIEQAKLDKSKSFNDKLVELGITLEQFNELERLSDK